MIYTVKKLGNKVLKHTMGFAREIVYGCVFNGLRDTDLCAYLL